MNCKNCHTEVFANFCPNCGHPTTVSRIDGHYIIQEMGSVLNFEKGLFFTIKELLIRPGNTVRTYLLESRNRLVKPILFIIITSLIYTFCSHFFNIEEGYIQYLDTQQSTTTAIFKWIQENYGYANILMGIFIAFWTKLFFKKSKFNFFEILILLCFVMGIGMLIFSVFGILQSIINTNLMSIAGVVGFVYTTYAIGNFFGKNKMSHYFKAFFAYVFGMFTFSLTAILLGIAIDLIVKQYYHG